MLSVWYILILNIYAIKYTRCISLKELNPKKEGLRIKGGRDALPGEYPYVLPIVAEIIKKESLVYQLLCTCACIKPTWSLTAAHCIDNMKSLNDTGVVNIKLQYNPSYKEMAYFKVLSMFMSPNYKSSSQSYFIHNDIGIIKTENIALSSYARVSSVDYSTLYGLKVTAVGYGLMLDDHGKYNVTLKLNKPLQVADAMIVKCDTDVSPHYCLTGTCKDWTSLGKGDSGGPVIHSSGIVGVNTASTFTNYRKIILIPGYEIKTFSGAITPVSPFTDWIVDIVK